MTEPSPPAIGPALEALRRAYQEAAAIVEAAPSSQEALERAAALFRAVLELKGEAAQLRHQKARRIWEEEELSLAHLARIMGVSKGRAGQLFPAGQSKEGKAS